MSCSTYIPDMTVYKNVYSVLKIRYCLVSAYLELLTYNNIELDKLAKATDRKIAKKIIMHILKSHTTRSCKTTDFVVS